MSVKKVMTQGNDVFGRFMMKQMWKSPPSELVAMYNKYMLNSRNHLVWYSLCTKYKSQNVLIPISE